MPQAVAAGTEPTDSRWLHSKPPCPPPLSSWTETYADERTLGEARARVRGQMVAFAAVAGVLVAGAPLATLIGDVSAGALAIVCGALLSVTAGAVIASLSRENRRVWRVDLSVHHAVSHDTAGRRRALSWDRVESVDVTSGGLLVAGRDGGGAEVRIEVSASMPGFTALAHRAVEYAEAHRRTVTVDGVPVDQLDLVVLYPTLCATRRFA